MSYDEGQAISKVSEIDSKLRELRTKEGKLNEDRRELNAILDLDDFERNTDGSYKIGTDGNKIGIKVTPIDGGTGKTITSMTPSFSRRAQLRGSHGFQPSATTCRLPHSPKRQAIHCRVRF